MKIKEFWLNLPVKDIQKSKDFYRKIGFEENPRHKDATHLASFFIGEKKVVLMLFPESDFQHFTSHPISDTSKGAEVLLNIDAQNRAQVDEMATLVEKAGGTVYAQPSESQGWMYALGFMDLDGHRWAMLYMEESKMPK